MKGTDRERITTVSMLMSRCLNRMRDSSYVGHAQCQDNVKLPPCFSSPAQGVLLTFPGAGSRSSTAATALPEASEMHQASGNRSSGYHGTENCSSTPPTEGEQQTVSIHEIQSQTFEKAEWERVKAAVDAPGWAQFCKTPENDTELSRSVMGMLQH